MLAPGLSDCFNCGPTERALMAKNLCTRCYKIEKVRNRFDGKPKKQVLWTKQQIIRLRFLRTTLKYSIPKLAEVFDTTKTRIKKSLTKFRIYLNLTPIKTPHKRLA